MEQIYLNGTPFRAEAGDCLSDLLQAHTDFKMPCGGRGHCGKCKVTATGALSQPDEVELALLKQEELAAGVRLACRTKVLGEAHVHFSSTRSSQFAPEISVATAQPLFASFGAVIDVGTTTLAAQLYSRDGLLASAGCDNPQSVFGADVISRMEKWLAGEGDALASAIRKGISGLLIKLADQAQLDVSRIDTVVITGNTAMLYLLTNRNPDPLTHAPFEADWLADVWLEGRDLELPWAGASVYLPPCISAFVGADITTALLSADILGGADTRMLMDIGTNGEIALWHRGKLLCCSTAAGPAFEGAGLSMGMQAEAGAVSHVTCTPEGLQAEVIGDTTPVGICGSGVVDAVSCLLESGELDETGYLEDDDAVIAGDVKLTQGDIRKVQLAKSAICAGMLTMLHQAQLEPKQLDELLIAGGFGSFLDLRSAQRIGLLPPEVELPNTVVLGNGALAGAAKLLVDRRMGEEARRIVSLASAYNLAVNPFFSEQYMMGMLFPEE